MRDHRTKRFDHDAHAEQRGDIGRIVGRRHLDHLEPAQALRRDEAKDLQRLARQEAAGSGQPVPGTKPQSIESTSKEM